MAKFKKEKLDEIINVELEGENKEPGLMEIEREVLDRFFPVKPGMEYRIRS
jgi:hypothetical protein